MDVYETLRDDLRNALTDLAILAGDIVGPSSSTWQDVAGTCAVNLRCLAMRLDELREGKTHFAGRFPITGPVVFPSPAEVIKEID